MKARWTPCFVHLGGALTICVFWLLCGAWAAPAESGGTAKLPAFLVVANPSVSANAVEIGELRDLFLRRTEVLRGQTCVPLNFPSGSELRILFDERILRMNPDQVGRYWVDLRIRGGGRPPRTIPSSEIMVRVVAALHAAVGYVPGDAVVPPGVKVLEVHALSPRAKSP